MRTTWFGNSRTAVFLSQHTVFPSCSRVSKNEDFISYVVLIFGNLELFTHRTSKYMYLRAKYTKYKMATTKFSIWRHIICDLPIPILSWSKSWDKNFSLIPGFCKILGSRDFSGRDQPEILSWDFTKKIRDLSGYPSQLKNLVNFIRF